MYVGLTVACLMVGLVVAGWHQAHWPRRIPGILAAGLRGFTAAGDAGVFRASYLAWIRGGGGGHAITRYEAVRLYTAGPAGTDHTDPGHVSIAAAARVFCDGRAGALVQKLHKIETATGFTIIGRSQHAARPL